MINIGMKITEIINDPRLAYKRGDREALKKAAGWYGEKEFIDALTGRKQEPRTHYHGYDAAGQLLASFSDPERGSRFARIERIDPSRQAMAAYRRYAAQREQARILYAELQQELLQDRLRELTFSPDEIEVKEIEPHFYIALLRGKRIGAASLNLSPEPGHPPDTRTIFKVAVTPEYQRRNVARKMYQRIEQDLAQRGLRLVPSNARTDDAIGFWKKYRPQ